MKTENILGRTKEEIAAILKALGIKKGMQPKEEPSSREGQVIPHNKWTLRDYLKGLDLKNSQELEDRADEIMGHVRSVMDPYVKMGKDDPLGKYYIEALEKIEEAYEKRDFEKEFPIALDFMIISVDYE